MSYSKDWQLVVCYRCPECGKRYVVAVWKQNPKCRQCGIDLRVGDQHGQPSPPAQKQLA